MKIYLFVYDANIAIIIKPTKFAALFLKIKSIFYVCLKYKSDYKFEICFALFVKSAINDLNFKTLQKQKNDSN